MAWNRPTSNTVDATSSSRPAGRGRKPGLKHGILAGAIIVVLGALCCFIFSGNETRQDAASTKGRGLIKEVAPAAAPKPRELTAEEKEQLEHPGMVKAPNGVWHPKGIPFDPKWTRPHGVVTNSWGLRSRSAANNATEQILINVFSRERGDVPPMLPARIPEREWKTMAETLIARSEVDETDTTLTALQKGLLNDVKAELRECLKKGGNVEDFIADYEDELKRCYIKRMDMRTFLSDMVKNGDDPALIRDMTAKLNEKLEAEHIKPLDVPAAALEPETENNEGGEGK